jgi:hypothetical protein
MKKAADPLEILKDPAVYVALTRAWKESQPGLTGGHEEGGFIMLSEQDKLTVWRWPVGGGNRISVPPHNGCVAEGRPIVATFHTHPNTGPDYLQEPSETDKRGVKEDVELKGNLYIGEFVVAEKIVYLITPHGTVREILERSELLS